MPDSHVSLAAQRQMEIYQAGVRGEKPKLPLAAEDLEQKAQEVSPLPGAFHPGK